MSPRRLVVPILKTLVVAWVAVAVVLTATQRLLIFPGAFHDPAPGARAPTGFEARSVETPDGVSLRALWKAPRSGCGVVLSFHGNGDVPESAARRFSGGRWASDGWGVMSIAYRGFPGSTGHLSGEGMGVDALAAYDEVARLAPGAPVLVHGHSLGTWPAVFVASRRPASRVYLEAPFLSMASLVAGRFPWLPTSLLLVDPMRSDLAMPDVAAPVVIVHGWRDGVVPVSQGRALAREVTGGAAFEEVDADHVGVFGLRDAFYEPRFVDRSTCPGSVAPRASSASYRGR